MLPDGTDARDVALWRERTAAEEALAQAELSLKQGQKVTGEVLDRGGAMFRTSSQMAFII